MSARALATNYSDCMTVYSLSPDAYQGLINLARDSRWCSDYARLLRYLDVVVSLNEATLLGSDQSPSLPADRSAWIQIAFLDTRISLPDSVLTAPVVIKKL